MKLTDQHIDELFQFTRKHFVEWYDLQCELVDHLANDIEQIWVDNPSLTFEEAKMQSFKKFGIFGFMDVVDKRRAVMEKRYRKLIWSAYVKYFKIPKIVLTVASIVALVAVFRLVNHNEVIIGLIGLVLMAFPFYVFYKFGKNLKARQERTGKKYMYESAIGNLGGLLSLTYLPMQMMIQFVDKVTWSPLMDIIVAMFLVCVSLFIYIAVKVVPSQVVTILKREHPAYGLV
ncbi:MAG: hypothetical protein CR968_00775 [Flavobacteriia bacterium]|nr:MAG: hypothetical protein CR968_00775 [Flavobacteriia bacterium]